MYVRQGCPYCASAVRVARELDLPCEVIDLTNQPGQLQRVKDITGQNTFPQIFIHGDLIGGYDQLMYLIDSGRLERMIYHPSDPRYPTVYAGNPGRSRATKRPKTPGRKPRKPARKPMLGRQQKSTKPPSVSIKDLDAYMPPDWQVIHDFYMMSELKPFSPPCSISMPEWQWRAVFNKSGSHVLLHSPCWVDMGYYYDFDVQPQDVMSKEVQGDKAIISLADGRMYRVHHKNPPGWGI